MNARGKTARSGGFILVVVLAMTLAIMVLVLGLYYRSRIGLQNAARTLRSLQALNAARSGLQVALAAVADANGRPPDLAPMIRFASGTCAVDLQAEAGKINLNGLIDSAGKPVRGQVDRLLRLIDLINRDGGPAIGYGIVPAILDWIDEDDQTTCLDFIQRENLGAESEYYRAKEALSLCPNRPFQTIDDLRWVRGIDTQTFQRLRDYLTVYGAGPIDLNAAKSLVIQALHEQIDPGLAQAVIDRRKVRPLTGPEDLRQIPGLSDEVVSSLAKSVAFAHPGGYYSVTCRGDAQGVNRTCAALIRKNAQGPGVDVVLYREVDYAQAGHWN